MRGKRMIYQIKMCFINNPYKRADFLRRNKIFHYVGDNVSYQPRKLPLYGQLISIGDNVVIGSNVTFITHDAYFIVCNNAFPEHRINEKVGCIKIGNNVFVGANANLMYDISIGDDCIIAAGSIVTKDVPSGEIFGGVPAHNIGYTKNFREKNMKNMKIRAKKEMLEEECVNNIWSLFEKKREK